MTRDRERANSPVSRSQIAMLHVAKAKLGMSDEEYQGMLSSVGVASSRELNQESFDECIRRLKAAGFTPVHKSAKASGMHVKPPANKRAMVEKIGAILADLGKDWAYADSMAKRMFGIDMLKFCNTEQTYKLMQALIVYQERQEKRNGADEADHT